MLYGRPAAFRLDNGPELMAQVFVEWCQQRGIELRYIQPGKPVRNTFIERFNRTYREEVLDAYLFHSTQEAQAISDAWLVAYKSADPTTRWVGCPRSRTCRASQPRPGPVIRGLLDGGAYHSLGVLDGTAVLKIGRDTSRPERVAAG